MNGARDGVSRYDGAWQIIRLNWPFYAVAGVVLIAWPLLHIHLLIGWLAWIATLWWVLASIGVSHWIYDRSPIADLSWLDAVLDTPPRRWINVHAGLDEHTTRLKDLLPASSGAALDIYDPQLMTEPAIQRARQQGVVPGARAHHSALPLRDSSLDVVFLIFAAHELRTTSSRTALFSELARVTAPGGRVILIEHLRDAFNVAAFGPGAWHFLPHRDWLQSLSGARFRIDRELRITPFVRVWSITPS